jgi:ABC-type protease/lipase transport system fused ATPase/permease subunit
VARTRLSLTDLSVRSTSAGTLILRGVSLDVPPGQMVQINGGSGRGKTVLAEAMLGICRRNAGKILIDGVNIERLSDDDRAGMFGYVPETAGFLEGTLAENIAHLDPDQDPEKVASAARKACLHATIAAMPDGYQTRIDPCASALSRGQRHQLALARAVYNSPKLLIMDEPDPMLLEVLPKTMESTFGHILNQGGSIILLSRKPLALNQISATYKLEGGKLKVVEPSEKRVAKLTVMSDKTTAPSESVRKSAASGLRG